MSKPIAQVRIHTVKHRSAEVKAVFDTGSHYTLVRESCLPAGTPVLRYAPELKWGTALQGSRLRIVGCTRLEIEIGERRIRVTAEVAPRLSRPLVIGAGVMQEWDISVKNKNGKTRVVVGKDMRDPDISMVL